MARRSALLLFFSLVALSDVGCCCVRSWCAQFRANHPCLFPCAHSGYPAGCGTCAPACDGCATCYSGTGPVAKPYPGAIFGAPQPITTTDPKAGMPNPMK